MVLWFMGSFPSKSSWGVGGDKLLWAKTNDEVVLCVSALCSDLSSFRKPILRTMVSRAGGEREEADVQCVPWQGRVGERDRQAAAFLGLDVRDSRHFPSGTLSPRALRSLHLLHPPDYGSNPSFTCAHHEYLQSPTVGKFLQLPPGCCLKRLQR